MTRWFKYLSLIAGGLAAWVGGTGTPSALAQDGAMTELYGYGVHRYYAGDYSEAQRALTMVVEAGIEDLRPHFFRGLTEYQLGMVDAAQADFTHAAELEAKGRRAVNVSFALQRIQGPVRHTIEMARLMARVSLYREQMTQPQPAGTAAPRPELNVPVAPGADIAVPPSLSPEAELAPGVAAPPVAVPPGEAAPPASTMPPDTEVNPFQDDQPVPAPATEPAPGTEPSPFDNPAAPAAPAEPATPTAPIDDPFSTPPPSDEPAPAAATTPEPAADADPF